MLHESGLCMNSTVEQSYDVPRLSFKSCQVAEQAVFEEVSLDRLMACQCFVIGRFQLAEQSLSHRNYVQMTAFIMFI